MFLFRLAEIKVDLSANYKKSAFKYKKNGEIVTRIFDDSDDTETKITKKEKVITKRIVVSEVCYFLN